MAKNNAEIAKVVSCENTFAALSSNGKVFTFALNTPLAADGSLPTHPKGHGATSSTAIVKPQCLWALRKQFSAVRDVALGADRTVILCTESGHVYVRQRLGKGGSFKFSKVPGLQCVLRVAASEAGAFVAIRVDCEPASIWLPP